MTESAASPAEARVDVVIVHYETPELLRDVLRSVMAARRPLIASVTVVDNSPSGHSAAVVRSEHPDIGLLLFPENIGYGSAVNRGLAQGTCEYALVLNADTVLHPGAVEALVDELDQYAHVGLVGPRLVDSRGRPQPSCGHLPTIPRLLLQETGLWRPALRFGFTRAAPFFDPGRATTVPWVIGAAFAVRRTSFDAVGGFDEGFFMYFEEVDLCRRLTAHGASVRFTPAGTVGHVGGASTRRHPDALRRVFFRSYCRYHRRYTRHRRVVLLRLAVIAIATAELLRDCVVRRRPDRAPAAAIRAWRALVTDALRGWPSA